MLLCGHQVLTLIYALFYYYKKLGYSLISLHNSPNTLINTKVLIYVEWTSQYIVMVDHMVVVPYCIVINMMLPYIF